MSDNEAPQETSGADEKAATPANAPSPKPARARPARKINAPTGKANVQIDTGPDLKKWAPYIAAGLTVAVVAALVRSPAFAAPGALAGALIVCALLGYAAAGHRIQLKGDDGLRKLIVPATVGIVLACAAPIVWTVYPPAAKGTVELREVGQRATVDLQGGVDLWATIQGQVDRNAIGNADFSVALTNGAQRDDLRGRLRVQDNGLIEHRNLSIRGPGTLNFELRGMASALTPPLRVTVHARPVPRLFMGVLALLLACIAIAIDASLRNRGMEPAYAAALCPLIVGMMYLQLRPVAGDGLPTDFLAAGLLGLVIGGLGGEGLGRAARSLLRR
jgi:hypothetical protein